MADKLSYAGVALPLVTPQLGDDWLARVHPRDVFRDFDGWEFDSPNSVTQSLPTPPIPTPPAFKFGVLQWPVGACRPAWFHAVVNRDILDQIRTAVGDPMTPKPLVLYDGRTGKTVTATMYLLPARPLNQLGHTKSDGWMLTLTDARFYWHWRRGVITDPSEGSWASLYNQIAAILGITITVETVNSAYGTPSKKWANYYVPTPAVLDAVANTVGQRVVVSLDGSVRTVTAGTAATESDTYIAASDPVMSGGYLSPQDIGRYVPASVKTLFLDTSTTPYPAAPHVETNTLASLTITGYGTAVGLSSFYQTLYADTPYTGTNTTEVEDYAERAATDWYTWRLSDVDAVWPGIEPYPMTGWEDTVEWTFQKRADAPFASTYVRRGPFSDMPSGDWKAGEETAPPVSTDCGNGCGWFAGMNPDWCLSATILWAYGQCVEIPGLNTDNPVFYLRWVSGEGKWVSQVWDDDIEDWVDVNFVYEGGSGPIRVWLDTTSSDQPSIAASINDIELVRDCCSEGTANFRGGSQLGLCTGSFPTPPCSPNTFQIQIKCTCCPIPGWEGDGWYCIVNSNEQCGVDTPTCVYLRESQGDNCNTSIILCDGPFLTQELCEAACTGTVTIPCTMVPVSGVTNVTAGSGPCATSMDGLAVTFTTITTGRYGLEFEDPSSGTRSLRLDCVDDVWTAGKTFTDSCQGGLSTIVTIIDATHLKITTQFGGPLCSDCDNETITVEITVTLA